MLRFEREYWDQGIDRIAGVDEAGRGPLAGPVVAAALIFDRNFAVREEHEALKLITDSKKLSASRRENIFELLQNSPDVSIGVGSCDEREIDTFNILKATHLAMARALQNLPAPAAYALIDGLPVEGLPCPSRAIVKGDSQSLSIAAASIIAKVTRDARMVELDRLYPQYGFAGHKGYGTSRHTQALFEHGPCPVHRRSFRPVRDAEGLRARLQGGDT